MNTTETLTALLSTECQCLDDDDNTAEYCDGCWDWMREGATELFAEWLQRNGNPQRVSCNGYAMGWQRLDGYAEVEEGGRLSLATKLMQLLGLRGDFTIRYTLEGDRLTAVRYSHDEPTGARFEFAAHEVTA